MSCAKNLGLTKLIVKNVVLSSACKWRIDLSEL